jgi:hypothetical protein
MPLIILLRDDHTFFGKSFLFTHAKNIDLFYIQSHKCIEIFENYFTFPKRHSKSHKEQTASSLYITLTSASTSQFSVFLFHRVHTVKGAPKWHTFMNSKNSLEHG